MMYRRLCNGLNDKGTLIKSNEEPFEYVTDVNKDWYISIFEYTEDQYQDFLVKGSIAGVTEVTTDKLIFDFDNKENIEEARQDTITLCDKLISFGISPDNLKISFSGQKGFGVELITKSRFTVNEFRNIISGLGGHLSTFDRQIINASRVIRIIGTKHQKSGRYKFPITYNILKEKSVDDILWLASSMDNVSNEMYEKFNWIATDLPKEILELKDISPESKIINVPIIDITDLDWEIKPKFLTNCRWALQNGFFKDGERSNALLCLGATYKNFGEAKGIAYRKLKGVAELQKERNGCEKFPSNEIYTNIISQIFGPGWKGGQFSCREPGTWLHNYCQSLGPHKCDHASNEDLKPKTFSSLAPLFKDYVVNIDKNTISTGLPTLDKHVFLSTGANVMVIGSAGCHAKGTKVILFDGTLKNVEDIQIGDKLMGPDSKPREVLKLIHGKEEMVKIIPTKGEEFIVNKSHILHLSPSYTKNIAAKCSINIKVNDFINNTTLDFKKKYKLIRTGINFNEKSWKSVIPPYILGTWLGDGHSSSIAITTMDQEILNEWLNFIKPFNLKCNKYSQKNNKSSTYRFTAGRTGIHTSNHIFNEFKNLNLIKNKHIPHQFLISSKNERLELLAGLLDTDGHLDSTKTYYEIINKDKNLAEQIVFLSRSLGLAAYLVECQKGCMYKGEYKEGTYYRITISGNTKEIPCRLSRKKAEDRKQIKSVLRTGFTWEILPKDDYYGFTLSGDHLYLTSDFIIHHNSGKTTIALELLSNTSKAGVNSVFASLDMAKSRIFEKLMYRLSGMDRQELYYTWKNNEESEWMEKLEQEFGNVNFFKKSTPTVQDIKDYVLACQQESGKKIKLVVIDYFERIISDFDDDVVASKRVAGELQDLVDDLDICLITLVQPNKNALQGGPDQPIHDYTKIKGSSFVYQSARIIISAWRPFYSPANFNNDKYMKMAVLKNDLGELAEFAFKWNGKRGLILEMDDTEREEFNQLLQEKINQQSERDKGNW